MKPIVCASGVELLMDYLEGVLPVEVRAAVDAHVTGCPRCVAFIASYQETPRILRDAIAPSMPVDLQESLLAALRAHRRSSGDDRLSRSRARRVQFTQDGVEARIGPQRPQLVKMPRPELERRLPMVPRVARQRDCLVVAPGGCRR